MTLMQILTLAMALMVAIRIVCRAKDFGIDRCCSDKPRCLAIATAYAAQLAGAVGFAFWLVWPAPALSFAPQMLLGGVLLSLFFDRRLK